MRVLVQRTTKASVTIANNIHGEINRGLVVLIGVEQNDSEEDADWLIQKICGLRIFSDSEGKMNLSIRDVSGEFLVISQFTLHASTKKGNRPSYIKAAKPEQAIQLYAYFIDKLKLNSELNVATGEFGADMAVQLINEGPVTIWMDSKNKE